MSECEPDEFRRRSQILKELLRESVNKNDTAAVERILREWGYNCLPYRTWVQLCKVALKNRCLSMVELLLPSDRISNNFEDFESNTQLIQAAIKSDFNEVVKYLQSKGIPLYLAHSISRHNSSALPECVRNNRAGVLKYVLELKYQDKNPDKDETLLMLCCHELNIERLEMLLKSELINTINKQSRNRQCSALHYCIVGREYWPAYCFDGRNRGRVLECVKLLVESGADINLKDINRRTPIQLAAERGMVTTVKYLAERGAHLDFENKQGRLLHCLALSVQLSDSCDECVQVLITQGMDMNRLNSWNETPLYLAVCGGHEEMVKSLIKSHCDVSIKGGNSMESVLLASIRLEHTTIAEILIQAGCDVNDTDKNGVTPLMECLTADNAVLVKRLIDQGSSVNAKDNEGTFVLDYLFCPYHRQNHRSSLANIVKVMIEAGADIHKGNNLLCRAIHGGHYKSASLLIEHGIDVNTADEYGDNPLALASEKGKLELVELLKTKDCDINHQNQKGRTALHKVVQVSEYQDKRKIINTLLLQTGINVNLRDIDGHTALSMAVGKGERYISEDLLTAGADVNHCDNTGQTQLMIAVKQQDTVMANILLKAGADLKPRDRLGRNAIYLAALLNVSLDLDVLLKYSNLKSEAKSIVNATDKNGKTTFMVAAERGPKAMVAELLMPGCNINLQDHNGKTALMFVVDKQNETILSLLIKNGADCNICDNNGKTALMMAVEKQKEIHCDILLRLDASVNHVDNNGNTALAIAVKMNNEKIVDSLLTVGADANQCDDNGKTVLMEAARRCNRSILECLLKAGADVNKTDTDGRSAIHGIMVGSGSGRKWINCLKLLLINKCHPSSLDTPGEGGKTLFQWLLEKNKEDLIWYLLTENCSLKGLDLPKVKNKFQFPDMMMLSKILFESGAPKSEIKTIILSSVSNTGLSRTTYNPLLEESEDKLQLDEFHNVCKSRSLKSRCRREIRNCIGPGISSKITQVGLPQYLQDYVVMKDLIPEKYFTLVIDDEDHSNARTDYIAGLRYASSASPI